MPSRILPGCSAAGCADRSVEGGAGKCAEHKKASAKAHDRMRGSSADRGYGYPWQLLRAAFLARHPLCEPCEARGRVTAAKHVDHRIARAQGGTDEESNLCAMCHPCHSAKTVEQDGGLGRQRAHANETKG